MYEASYTMPYAAARRKEILMLRTSSKCERQV
jgi:hypothetical protein